MKSIFRSNREKTKQGYIVIYIPDHPRAMNGTGMKGFVYEHITIVEKAIGHYLDPRHEIHHFDEIKSNNVNTNLVVCENKQYHDLLHTRQRIVKLGGDPNMDKFCSLCQLVRPKTLFSKNRSNSDGLHSRCRLH